MIGQGVKAALSIVAYGVLLAIGFRLGQKAYDVAEQRCPDLVNRAIQKTTEVVNDTCRRFSCCKETGDRSPA